MTPPTVYAERLDFRNFVFHCDNNTIATIYKTSMFAAPEYQLPKMKRIDSETALYLYNTSDRMLIGPFAPKTMPRLDRGTPFGARFPAIMEFVPLKKAPSSWHCPTNVRSGPCARDLIQHITEAAPVDHAPKRRAASATSTPPLRAPPIRKGPSLSPTHPGTSPLGSVSLSPP